MNDTENRGPKKRSLTKVRKEYLHKKPSTSSLSLFDPFVLSLEKGKVYSLARCIGLVEVNREIIVETRYLNEQYRVQQINLDDGFHSPVVSLDLAINTNASQPPWEYTVKRLESYGDLQLATWAAKLRKYYTNQEQSIKNYYSALRLEDTNRSFPLLDQMRMRAEKLCKEIESKYSFHRADILATKTGTELLNVAFDGGFLKLMDHTPESFAKWCEKNGLPSLFKEASSINMKFGQLFLDNKLINAQFGFYDGGEFESFVINEKGQKHPCVLQNLSLLFPEAEGFMLRTYYIVKKQKGNETQGSWSQSGRSGLKAMKFSFDQIMEEIPNRTHLIEEETNDISEEKKLRSL